MGKKNAVVMFSQSAIEERVINKFQSPFNINYTPYKNFDFKNDTIKLCKDCHGVSGVSYSTSKVIILGDASVGKTSIINRYCRKLFESNYKATIGVDFEVERYDILQIPYCLQIWDTAGQERFQSIAQCYYRGANVIVLVFDLNNIASLYNCQNWLKEALYASGHNQPLIFLVGTKKDLLSKATYKSLENSAIIVADKLHSEYWSLSSKTGENVDKFFNRVACLSFERSIKNSSQENRNITVESLSFQKKTPNKTKNRLCTETSCSSK